MRFIALFFFIHFITVNGQRLKSLDTDSGLSQPTVYDMCFDTFGNLWCGTRNGLNKFDGNTFEVFKKASSGLEDNEIVSLLNVSNDSLWILTTKGNLHLYSSKTNTINSVNNTQLDDFVVEGWNKMVYQSNQHRLWIANSLRLGYLDIISNDFVEIEHSKGITDLICVKDQVFSIAEKSVYRIEESLNYPVKVKIRNLDLIKGKATTNGGFLGINQSGIYEFDKNFESIKKRITFESLHTPISQITDFLITSSHFWVSTYNGVYAFNRNPKIKSRKHYLKGKIVLKLAEDHNGDLWFGTGQYGLYYYQNSAEDFYDRYVLPTNYFKFNPVVNSAICNSKKGSIWVGFIQNGVALLQNDTIVKHYVDYYDLNDKRYKVEGVNEIIEDGYGNIWISTLKGVLKLNPKKDRFETLDNDYNFSWPYQSYTIKQLNDKYILLTGDEHIAILDINNGDLSYFPKHQNGISIWKGIRDIEVDNRGNFWIVQNTYGLVFISKDLKKYQRMLKDDVGFSDNKIYDISIYGNQLWIASNSGIDVYDLEEKKVVSHFSEKNGLSSNITYAVYKCENMVWAACSNGIQSIHLETNEVNSVLNSERFNEDAHFKDTNGNLFFGGYDDIIKINTKFTPKRNSQQIVITNSNNNLNDKEIGDNGLLIDKKASSTSVKVTAYPFKFPNHLKIKYKILGKDSLWNYSSSNKFNLKNEAINSQDTLQLSIANNETYWGKTVTIPLFTKSSSRFSKFKILLFVFGLGSLYFFSSIIIKRKKRQIKSTIPIPNNVEQIKDEPIKTFEKKQEQEKEQEQENLLQQVDEILKQHYTDTEFNVENLSNLLFMSRATFYRKFKKIKGVTASRYLRNYRLERAKELLVYEDTPISEIGFTVGFKSNSQFRINFKELTGQTPLQFRKENRPNDIV